MRYLLLSMTLVACNGADITTSHGVAIYFDDEYPPEFDRGVDLWEAVVDVSIETMLNHDASLKRSWLEDRVRGLLSVTVSGQVLPTRDGTERVRGLTYDTTIFVYTQEACELRVFGHELAHWLLFRQDKDPDYQHQDKALFEESVGSTTFDTKQHIRGLCREFP